MDEALLGDSVASSFLGGLCGSAIGRETEGMHYARILALRGPLERSAFFMRHELDADERDTSGQESIPHQDDPWLLCSTGMQRIDLAMLFQVLLAKAWLVLDHPPQVREVADHVLKTIPAAWPEYEDLRQISLDVAGNDAYFSRDRTWDAPLGWFFATHPEETRSGGHAPAAAIAAATQPGATIECVVQATLDACQVAGLEGPLLGERIAAALELAQSCSTIQEFCEGFYQRFLVSRPDSVLEIVPAALACVTLGKGDLIRSILVGVAMGRQSPAIAGLAGQIAGALKGGNVPETWLAQIQKTHTALDLIGMTERLAKFAIEQAQRAKAVHAAVLRLCHGSSSEECGIEKSPLFDKLFGALVGGACGDALGCPAEWMHFQDIQKQWGWIDGFVDYTPQVRSPHNFYQGQAFFGPVEDWQPSPENPLGAWSATPGTYSDDMRFRLLLCYGLLDKRRAITGSEFAEILMRYRIGAEKGAMEDIPSWKGPELQWARMLTSEAFLAEISGRVQPVGAAWAWDAPIGMLYPGDEALAARHGYLMAVCMAHALHPQATVDSTIACALSHSRVYGEFGLEMEQRIQAALDLVSQCETPAAFFSAFYERLLVTQPTWWMYVLEQLPAALALLTYGKQDPSQAILAAVNIGRDNDTIACMVGELIGALKGASSLPGEWVQTVLQANPEPDLRGLAARFSALVAEGAGWQGGCRPDG